MAVERSFLTSRWTALAVTASALTLLAGCVVAPAEPYEVGVPVVYSSGYHGPVYGYGHYPYGYSAPHGSPSWGPAVSLGFFGHWSDHRRDRDHHWRGPPPRGSGNHWVRPGGQRPPSGSGAARPGNGFSPGRRPGTEGAASHVRPPRAPERGSARPFPGDDSFGGPLSRTR